MWMSVNYELRRRWKEMIFGLFQITSLIFLEGLSKTTKTLHQDSRLPVEIRTCFPMLAVGQ
jgi:hypothetical protein